jgi:TRAP-type C4-dicarboxylate transport system substrate-binding protein
MAEATAEQRHMAQQGDRLCTQAIQAAGSELHSLSPEQRESFIAATRAVVAAMRNEFSAEVMSLFKGDLAGVTT